jgi:TPR repeat protein
LEPWVKPLGLRAWVLPVLVLLFLGLFPFLAAPAKADYASAVKALEEGDFGAARREFRRLAEKGDAKARLRLAILYDKGEGGGRDVGEAARWYGLAADEGLAVARFNLGSLYEHGDGVKKNLDEAVRLYRQAAEQNLAHAQYNLGVLYAEGRGVALDYAEAARRFRQAAEQGLGLAQYNLGVLYAEGRGVLQDSVAAHMWFNLAALTLKGEEHARAAKRRDAAAARMTPEQIAEAQRRAREWRPNGEGKKG